MDDIRLRTIFWNTWLDMQDGSRGDGSLVAARLDRLVQEYSPDVFGLSEVVLPGPGRTSPLISGLERHGYTVHFCSFGSMPDNHEIGSVFASKFPPERIVDHSLGQGLHSRRPGMENYAPRLIEAQLLIGSATVTVFVVHLIALMPADWSTHAKQRRAFDRIIAAASDETTIIGGDFNELKYMLPLIGMSERFHRKSGSFMRPTWRPYGKRSFIVRANYDQLLYSRSKSIDLSIFNVLDMKPSDHAPLYAEFLV